MAAECGSVLQVGPALSVRGGVSAVERLIMERAGAAIQIHHIATMEDGSLWRKLRVFVKAIRELRRRLRGQERLVVHIHFASRGSTLRKALLAWMTLRARRPLIMHAHGASFEEFFEGLPRTMQRVLQRTFARADCFLVLSTQWRDFYTQRCGLPVNRVQILYNPTSLPANLPVRSGRARVQFLFLGRIGQRKGAFDLLEAFARLPPEVRTRARLVFAGDGELERLREQARSCSETVEIHSWIDTAQRDALLAQSDVFILPSYHEGVPMAMLEAMAWGLPVITTPVGGIPDVVMDQKEGLIIQPGDGSAIQHAMRALIEDEERRLTMGHHARARAATFDVERYGVELVGIYQRLLFATR